MHPEDSVEPITVPPLEGVEAVIEGPLNEDRQIARRVLDVYDYLTEAFTSRENQPEENSDVLSAAVNIVVFRES